MRINHNISALNAWRNISQTQYSMSKTLERLSSGLRINRAGDDAAGLAISEKMRGQIKGLNMAIKNAQDAISLIQTAEGALTEVHSILQRMRELAVQAASDTNTDVDREQIQKEIDQLREEIDRIARTTEFNTKKLLDGKLESFRSQVDAKVVTGGNINVQLGSVSSAAVEGTYVIEVGQFNGAETSELDVKITLFTAGGYSTTVVTITVGSATVGNINFTWDTDVLSINDFGGALPKNEVVDSAVVRVEAIYTSASQLIFQIGANEGHNMVAGIDDMSAAALGLTTVSLDVTTQDAAERAIMVVDAAIHRVSTARAALGAVQNRLEHTISNLGVAAENLTAAESRIRDADMAKEMMEFTKQQILLQSSMAMLAQSNTLPQNVLQLMR
ncbi:flagellin [Thermotoga maritima MSB8]|uniref:Flagellin n=1 Tax=Thermotoga maritima (strain ATCC 43589 / DSM 3109 / JCM 10099 / NBRC 100826 / MSB8) TaxID=243274 RepID=Q9WZL7_THEMA|nr:flagellin [Thermotoga maritima]AAD35840.1 flagellin [Thermotoga maritima MSB8]AGL49684.1 Flagellin protein FlaA [Thermotoga maritima MSB8]AHD17487.1 flagellin [Thermotoga maritima MSB8]AKE26675.1 flagellin [Thermotoga maritima]AKE28539.1 flagellin [Thermotoga maritima MSB8]